MMYGVFKTFKHGECMDSNYIVIFEDEADAKRLVEILMALKKDDRKDLAFGGNEGWEWTSWWMYEEVPQPSNFNQFITESIDNCVECDDKDTAKIIADMTRKTLTNEQEK